jgi:cation diffusion facilitator CzcD-associated flavoprotein CzcO
MSKLRVAIIGAGGAGLAICQCLENEPRIEHVVYERASSVGGTWRYTKNDKNQINTPMYKNLR